MKIVTHKCPNCGSNLKLKPGQTEGVCEYCQFAFSIDDEVKRTEHKTTVEIKSDNDFEIAMATLDNFKDYKKSEYLFKDLLDRYAHKKEIYIGIVRSITHDFTKQIKDINTLNEVNEYFNKYKSLAQAKEISKYEDQIKEINKNYWHKELTKATGNFNAKKSSESIKEIEEIWSNYIIYCTKEEKTVIEIKYKEFLKRKKNDVSQKKRMTKFILGIIVIVLVAIFLIDYISLTTEKAKQRSNKINASEISKNCETKDSCKSYDFIKKYFKNTRSNLLVEKGNINLKTKTLTVTIKLKNRYKTTTKEYKFNLIDDMGPIISQTNCTYKDTEKVDVNACFNLYDYTDGKIENDKATVEYDEKEFKTEGTKQITVTVSDKEGNETTKKVNIIITKSDMDFEIKLSKIPKVGETAKLSYTFDPSNIPNKEVEISYDKNYVSIDKNNNVKALKRGKTNICITSKYNNRQECINLNIELKCQSTYTFKFNGGSKETKTAGEDFCTGKYKLYASVLNRDKMYSVEIKPKNEFVGDYVTIYKTSSFLSEEGSTYVFNEGTTFTTEQGITQVKLVKVS